MSGAELLFSQAPSEEALCSKSVAKNGRWTDKKKERMNECVHAHVCVRQGRGGVVAALCGEGQQVKPMGILGDGGPCRKRRSGPKP